MGGRGASFGARRETADEYADYMDLANELGIDRNKDRELDNLMVQSVNYFVQPGDNFFDRGYGMQEAQLSWPQFVRDALSRKGVEMDEKNALWANSKLLPKGRGIEGDQKAFTEIYRDVSGLSDRSSRVTKVTVNNIQKTDTRTYTMSDGGEIVHDVKAGNYIVNGGTYNTLAEAKAAYRASRR